MFTQSVNTIIMSAQDGPRKKKAGFHLCFIFTEESQELVLSQKNNFLTPLIAHQNVPCWMLIQYSKDVLPHFLV